MSLRWIFVKPENTQQTIDVEDKIQEQPNCLMIKRDEDILTIEDLEQNNDQT